MNSLPETKRHMQEKELVMKQSLSTVMILAGLNLSWQLVLAQTAEQSFAWPDGKQIALSLTFDDARSSQVNGGTDLLDRHGVRATFYVIPERVEQNLAGWKKAVASGHEIGNHSLRHPCTGNFDWSREKALEDYDLDKMRSELMQANKQIERLLGVIPRSFAYPCGETYVGRGLGTTSYVPLIAELFSTGRTWLDETANDPGFCDLAHLRGLEMDGKDFDAIKTTLENAKGRGLWVVLAGHEMADEGRQTTRLQMLEQLLAYARDPANGVWLAPVGEVASYVTAHR